MNTSGVYAIRCTANSKVYIGQSIKIDKRKAYHFSSLRGGYHENKHLQRSFNKHGESSFIFCVIEYSSVEMLDASEIFWIRFFKSDDGVHGYNAESGGNENKIMSAETRAKISAAGMGRVQSQETIARRVAVLRGQKRSAEFCKKLGDRRRGVVASPETLLKMSASRKGFCHSAETKAKMSTTRMGYKPTPEAIAKSSASRLGMKFSTEHRAAMSASAKTRKPISDETRERLSNSTRLVWLNRKQKIAV